MWPSRRQSLAQRDKAVLFPVSAFFVGVDGLALPRGYRNRVEASGRPTQQGNGAFPIRLDSALQAPLCAQRASTNIQLHRLDRPFLLQMPTDLRLTRHCSPLLISSN